jgi:protein-tyrosine phosphatase
MATTILAVCTGNICRSPVLARLLTARTDGSVLVGSAGVRARADEPIEPRMAHLLQSRGLDGGQFAARQLTPDMIRGATVVVTMTRAQRSAVVRAVPEAVRRTFTLLELAHVLSTSPGPRSATDDATRWARVPELVSLERLNHAAGSRELDIEDPYGRNDKTFRRVFDLVGHRHGVRRARHRAAALAPERAAATVRRAAARPAAALVAARPRLSRRATGTAGRTDNRQAVRQQGGRTWSSSNTRTCCGAAGR